MADRPVLRMYLDIVKPIPFHSRILEHISRSFARPSKVHFDLRWSEKNENLPSQSLHWTRHDRRHFVNMYSVPPLSQSLPPKRNLVGETGEHVFNSRLTLMHKLIVYLFITIVYGNGVANPPLTKPHGMKYIP